MSQTWSKNTPKESSKRLNFKHHDDIDFYGLFRAHLFLRYLNIERARQRIQIYHQQRTAQNRMILLSSI